MRLATATTLAVALAAACASAQCNGIDYPNGDFPSDPYALPAAAAQPLCLAMCSAEPQCANSVFIPPSCDPGVVPPTCYIKAQLTAPVSKACRCSQLPNRTSYAARTDTSLYTLTSTSTGLTANLGSFGLTGLSLALPDGLKLSYGVELDSWALAIQGFGVINSSALTPVSVTPTGPHLVTYAYTVSSGAGAGSLAVAVAYELEEGWTFVKKTITLTPGPGLDTTQPLIVGSVSPWDALRLVPSSSGSQLEAAVYPSGDLGQYGVFLRMSDGTGVLAAVTNPFLWPLAAAVPSLASGSPSAFIHVGYHPGLGWPWTSPLSNAGAVTPLVLDSGVLSVYPMPAQPGPYPPFTTVTDSPGKPSNGASGRLGRGTTTTTSTARKAAAAAKVPFPSQGVAVSHDYGTGMRVHYARMDGKALSSLRDQDTYLDATERDAFRSIVTSLAVAPPSTANRIHIPWTENDYEIDISNPADFPQYQRILTRLNQLGVKTNLFAGSDYSISNRANNTDSWGWEQTLFLSNGQHIREGYYYPAGQTSLPPTTQALVQASAALSVSNVPYVYPILGFRNASFESNWLYSVGNGLYQSRLDDRVFQDWLVRLLADFAATTGARGAGFDYTFYQDSNATAYAQWAGWKRVLALARQRMTSDGTGLGWTVDNRQLNHMWSPWMWTAGSYAEPFQTDEGPYSWPAYVQDPHTDRQSGNNQRKMNYDYAQGKLCPALLLPGFIGHQSDRFLPDGSMPVVNTTLNIRDYDFYGNTYGLLSSLATGPLNHVVCGLPARDAGEFAAFPATVSDPRSNSIAFITRWLAFSDLNRDVMLQVKPLPVQPAPGVVDGTYAVLNNAGFLFLFNPNTRVTATQDELLAADGRLGLSACDPATQVLVVGEVWPVETAVYTTVPCGQRFSIVMEGRGAAVFNLSVATGASYASAAVHGSSVRAGTRAAVTAASGSRKVSVSLTGLQDLHRPQDGTCKSAPVYLQLPSTVELEGVAVGGRKLADSAVVALGSGPHQPLTAAQLEACPARATAAPAPLPGLTTYALYPTLTGPTFAHSAPITGMGYNPSFAGGTLTGTVNVPQAVFDQLAARNASYPVPWDASSDAVIPWLLPGRLIAALDSGAVLTPTSIVNGTLDGAPIPVQPVWSCRSYKRIDCFSGYWLDLSAAGVQPDTAHTLVLNLPSMPVGAFQGVYYDNVDAVFASSE